MKHPTIKQVDYVIKKLKSVAPQAIKEGAFDMGEGKVYYKSFNFLLMEIYKCGTVHCTGGWYAVANFGRKVVRAKYDLSHIGYRDGARLMAKDLGFGGMGELENWARDNPNIWGNEHGRGLFWSAMSYNNPGFAGVVKQFEIVRSNLTKLGGLPKSAMSGSKKSATPNNH